MFPALTRASGLVAALAETPQDIREAQRLRYRVFSEECPAYGAHCVNAEGRDEDAFDARCDHLILRDSTLPHAPIVGTYRLLTDDGGAFYTEGEFDISPLRKAFSRPLELGRSCVLPGYRSGAAIQALWMGIARYVLEKDIDVMFGCASFTGADVARHAAALRYLRERWRAPEGVRPVSLRPPAVPEVAIPDERQVFSALPPLLKGYLRVGGKVGDAPVIDEVFGTVDVCMVVPVDAITPRYRRHFLREP